MEARGEKRECLIFDCYKTRRAAITANGRKRVRGSA